jgi:hypothetical protein
VKTVTIKLPEGTEGSRFVQTLPAGVLSSSVPDKRLRIESPIASIELQSNMLSKLKVSSSPSVELVIGEVDKTTLDKKMQKKIGDKPVLNLNLQVDGKVIEWKINKAPVKISIPYQPSEKELKHPEHIVVWYIDGKGNAQAVHNARYDSKTGMVVFETTHFSQFAIGAEIKTFKDVENLKWAEKRDRYPCFQGHYQWSIGRKVPAVCKY